MPLGIVRDNLRFVVEVWAEDHFADGQGPSRLVAQKCDVQFPAVDVLFDDGRLRKSLYDANDRSLQRGSVVSDGIKVDAHGGVFARWLDDEGKREVDLGEIPQVVDNRKLGRGDSSSVEDLLRTMLVQSESKRQRSGTGVGDAQRVESER